MILILMFLAGVFASDKDTTSSDGGGSSGGGSTSDWDHCIPGPSKN